MRACILPLCFVFLACSTATSTSSHFNRAQGRSDQYMIGESRVVAGESLFDLLRRTRPTLLTVRASQLATSSPLDGEDLGVYVNGMYVGGLDAVRGLQAGSVYSVRRYRGIDSTNRFARHHRDGALEITLLR
jgi:hypothetical protein